MSCSKCYGTGRVETVVGPRDCDRCGGSGDVR